MSGTVGAVLLIILALFMVLFAFGSFKTAGRYDDESDQLYGSRPCDE